MRKPIKTPVIVLTLFTLIILLPPLIYDYVYPNTGDDSAIHLAVIDSVYNGEEVEFAYLGQAIVAYPMVTISKITGLSVDSLFLWFNYLTLVGVGFTFYFILSRLVNKKAGLLIIPIAIFCTPSILVLFQCGTIFHLINTCILLPWGLFFLIRWIQDFKPYQATLALGFFLTFSIFHITAIYLPFVLGLFIIIVSCTTLAKKKVVAGFRILAFGVLTIGLGALLSYILIPSSQSLAIEALEGISGGIISGGEGFKTIPPPAISNFLAYYVGLFTTTILMLLIITLVLYPKTLKLTTNTKLLLVFLTGFAVMLIIVSFVGIGPDPLRTSMDLATTIAIVVTILGALILVQVRKNILIFTLPLIVSLGVVLTLIGWLGYNSTIRPIDIQVSNYLNNQQIQSYNYSTQIASWVYDRILDNNYSYSENESLVIFRTKPMTPRTDPTQFHFKYDKPSSLEDYDKLKILEIFDDGEVQIYVFEGD